jgi:hypothetical protein
VTVNNQRLEVGDGIAASDESAITIAAQTDAEIVTSPYLGTPLARYRKSQSDPYLAGARRPSEARVVRLR